MAIDVALLFSGVAVLVSLIFGISNWKRGAKQDTANETTHMTTVIVKLEAISEGIAEIRADMKTAKAEIAELRERTAKVESAAASAHKRVDLIERKGV